jgi:hypothetical protein
LPILDSELLLRLPGLAKVPAAETISWRSMEERLLAPASTHRNIGDLNSTYRPIAEARVLYPRISAAQLECFGSKKPIAYPSPELVFGSAYCCQLSGS